MLASDEAYSDFFDGAPPLDFASEWLVLVHPNRRPFGTHYEIVGLENDGSCGLDVQYSVQALGDNCANFEYTRPGPALVRTDIAFTPPPVDAPTLTPAPGQAFDCESLGALEFEVCSEEHWCAPGLICAGITRSDSGLCMDASLRGTFASPQLDLEILAGETLVEPIIVDGLASVDMDVIVAVNVEHPDPAVLTITLTNPDTNEVLVWDQEPSPYTASWYPDPGLLPIWRVPVGFSGDESVNGEWRLKITNAGEDSGVLIDWSIEIMSRYD